MIKDPEAFMDPYGGRPTTNPMIESPFAIAFAAGVESGLFNKYIASPLEKTTKARHKDKYLGRDLTRRIRTNPYRFPIGPGMTPTSPIFGPTRPVYGPQLPDRSDLIRMQKRRLGYGQYRNAYGKTTKQFSSLRGGARTLGLVTLAASMADLGAMLTKPGVRQAAVQSDQRAIEAMMPDSGVAYTQRQRAVMAIYDSQSTINNVIGSEAQYFHR